MDIGAELKYCLKRYMPLLFLVIALACAWYAHANRYFLRFMPLPISSVEIVNDGSWLTPSFEPSNPGGSYDFGSFNLTTEEGLRNTLNKIQNLSPPKGVIGLIDYSNRDFNSWIKDVTSKPIYCTDGSLLIILAAKQQGLRAREWHLLPPGWPPGNGHSVAEIFNPKTNRWQLVDGQHAAIIRNNLGQILDMTSVLKMYAENGRENIQVDYGPYKERMLNGMRGPSTENYFFDQKLLDTPVLQLRPVTWFASVARNYFGLSGHFIIGYPIVLKGWTHDTRILSSKLAALGMIFFGLLFIWLVYRRFSQRNLPA